MKATIAISALCLILAGCSTTGTPPVNTVYVKIPVATDCVPLVLQEPPVYPDTDAALRSAPDAAERYRLMAAGRVLRDARLGELEPVIQSCRKK